MQFQVSVTRDEDGVFAAEVPALPGCLSQGWTRAEAIANTKEAVAADLESLRTTSEPMPPLVCEEVMDVHI